jgi:hypothetical protein
MCGFLKFSLTIMNKYIQLLAKACLTISVLLLTLGCGSKVPASPTRSELSEAQIAQIWEEQGSPNLKHKALEKFVGNWKTEVRWWMGPGGMPDVSYGTSTNTMIFGGRFIEERFEGRSLGRAFSGLGIVGYDNTAQKYESIWIDSLNTSIMRSIGSVDETLNVFNYEGNLIDPVTKEAHPSRSIVTWLDKDNYRFEMYERSSDGTDYKGFGDKLHQE